MATLKLRRRSVLVPSTSAPSFIRFSCNLALSTVKSFDVVRHKPGALPAMWPCLTPIRQRRPPTPSFRQVSDEVDEVQAKGAASSSCLPEQ